MNLIQEYELDEMEFEQATMLLFCLKDERVFAVISRFTRDIGLYAG
jgi:hypothetical protein